MSMIQIALVEMVPSMGLKDRGYGHSVSGGALEQSLGMGGWKVEAAATLLRDVGVDLKCLMRFEVDIVDWGERIVFISNEVSAPVAG